ncbi:MAG: hypothetical protein JRJ77_11780 [Deltaproteobacteria bacterium]|nr:hypothetical protein [Deltaproteobacteria bacterium]
MNRFEEELLHYINDIFRDEIRQKIVEVATNTDQAQHIVAQETDSGEFVIEQANSPEGWMVEIVRTTTGLKHVRIVIKSPDANVMNRIDDYRSVLRTMVERAKDILSHPPFEQYVSQGVIQATDEVVDYVEYIPRDKISGCGKMEN